MNGSRPDRRSRFSISGIARGLFCAAEAEIAEIWSGVVPQQRRKIEAEMVLEPKWLREGPHKAFKDLITYKAFSPGDSLGAFPVSREPGAPGLAGTV